MKCWFKRHEFIRRFDIIVGGLISRHVACKNCGLGYDLLWHLEKPRKPPYRSIRIKTFPPAYIGL